MAEKSDSCIKNGKKKVAALHPIFRPRPQLNCETADSNPHKSQQKKIRKKQQKAKICILMRFTCFGNANKQQQREEKQTFLFGKRVMKRIHQLQRQSRDFSPF